MGSHHAIKYRKILFGYSCYPDANVFIDIRLNGTDTEGFLEANEDSGWGAVCSNSFSDEEARVACRQLRLGLPVLYRGNTSIASSPYYFLHLYCDGTEQRLSGCNTYSYYNICYSTYLQCSGKYVDYYYNKIFKSIHIRNRC